MNEDEELKRLEEAEANIEQYVMKYFQAIAKRKEAQLERERTVRIVLIYCAIFLPIAWLIPNPVWSWAVLGVGVADWIYTKVKYPIRVQLMGMTVQRIHRDDNG